ncbi:chromate transporter [Pseudoramibacter alactolyticus]|jgi:chromate transporter|uniref:chromate transporter n=1 Tax=Pseudoramibacter alactolyticus TaxID=113287 RepID=UPI002354FEFA|nr:chromate transporter [Pseudoramibacter alactolyticus]MBM6968150.1 chromate transporter [Pseudoramibacter alactolyticus]
MMYLRLFWEFFKTGLFSIGGGLATLPFLKAIGQSTGWFTQSQLADMVAVSESTPGPMGINMATYVGYTVGGVPGGIIATIGEVAPAIVIIIIIAAFLKAFEDNEYVKAGFYGLRPASTGLIAAAGLSVAGIALFKSHKVLTWHNWLGLINIRAVIFAVVLLVATRWIPKVKNWHPILFIAVAAAVGMLLHFSG